MLKLNKESIAKVSGGGHGHLERHEQNTKSRNAKDFIGHKNFIKQMKALKFPNNSSYEKTPYNSSKANATPKSMKYLDFNDIDKIDDLY